MAYKWCVVVFENKYAKFKGEVAYVKGPFDEHEQADTWMATATHCLDGMCQVTTVHVQHVDD